MSEAKKPWEETWACRPEIGGPKLDSGVTALWNEDLERIGEFACLTGGGDDLDRGRLAAAAPELYRALARCADALSKYTAFGNEEYSAVILAIDAIRKARGES